MPDVVGKLVYEFDTDDKKLGDALDKNDKKVQDFGKDVGAMGSELRDGLNKAAVGMAAVGAGLTLAAKKATDFTVEAVRDAKNLGREIGVSTTEASRLTAAFGRMGIEADSARQMFGIFSKNIVASTENVTKNKLANEKLQLEIDGTKRAIAETTIEINKNGDKSGELNLKLKELNNTLQIQQSNLNKNSDAFGKLGIKTVDATGKQKDFTTLLFEVADQFKAMPAGIDKTALAMELFGRQGKDMIKVLDLGSQGIQDLQKRADEMGLTLNENTIGKVNELIQSQKALKEQTDVLKIAIGTATAPVLTEFNMRLNDIILSILGTDGVLRDLTVGFIAFGGPVFAGGAALVGFGANLVQLWPVITGVWGAVGKLSGAIFSLTGLTIGIWVAMIVADLYLVVQAANAVKGAFDAVFNAQKAAANLAPPGRMTELQKQATAARARGDTKEVNRIANALRALGGNAAGTENWRGGLTAINERGPEIVDLPRGTRIIPNQLSREMVRNGGQRGGNVQVNIGTVNDRSDADYILRRLGRNQERLNMGVSMS